MYSLSQKDEVGLTAYITTKLRGLASQLRPRIFLRTAIYNTLYLVHKRKQGNLIRSHVEEVGDTAWSSEGALAGFRGKAKRIEEFAARLTGPQADKYDVFYTAHIQNVGDTPVTANGQYCGTRGKGLRVEGMTVWVEPKA